MRILFLTNFYPPASRGGFERWCQEVADGLVTRGHELAVLTSKHNREAIDQIEHGWIHRDLNLEMEFASFRNSIQFFTKRKSREAENQYRIRQLIADFEPEVALIWGMWNLSDHIPALIENLMPGRVAYYMGDYWPTLPSQIEVYWQVPPHSWATSIPKYLLKDAALRSLAKEEKPNIRFKHVIFPTTFMRDDLTKKGFSPARSSIVYGAIDTRPYLNINGSTADHLNGALNLLFVGRLDHEKGPHLAIDALGHLVKRFGFNNLKLIIVGEGEPEYEQKLRQLAKEKNVDSAVIFRGALPGDKLPELYHEADIFLFTSIWPEPFGRVIIEAMAAKIAVVGSATGGAAEIMVDKVNALLFIPGDAADLATKTAQLIVDPGLRKQLAEQGRVTAMEKFDVDRMVVEIEAYLAELVK